MATIDKLTTLKTIAQKLELRREDLKYVKMFLYTEEPALLLQQEIEYLETEKARLEAELGA